jgi:hypothetical protein
MVRQKEEIQKRTQKESKKIRETERNEQSMGGNKRGNNSVGRKRQIDGKKEGYREKGR